MVGQEQLESSPLCQHSDNETETKRECSVVIPDDWQLTSQQQAFIELFAEDDQPILLGQITSHVTLLHLPVGA